LLKDYMTNEQKLYYVKYLFASTLTMIKTNNGYEDVGKLFLIRRILDLRLRRC
jgi:hypothetical protein